MAVQRFGHPVNDVASLLRKNPGTVSRWLGIARERKRTDTAFLAYVSTATDAIVYSNDAIT